MTASVHMFNDQLHAIHICDRYVTSATVEKLQTLISGHCARYGLTTEMIERLNVDRTYLNGRLREILDIIRSAQTRPGILEICFYQVTVSCEDMKVLAKFICDTATTMNIKMTSCELNDDAMDSIIKMVRTPSVVDLDLTDNMFTGGGMARLTSVLGGTSLIELNLNKNPISRLAAEALAKALPHTNIIKLHLSQCRMGIQETSAILKAVKHSKIKRLNLSRNTIGSCRGPHAINEALENRNLQMLSMACTDLTNRSLEIITSGIVKSRTIRTLDISVNSRITVHGINRMLKSIEYHSSLSYVQAAGCSGTWFGFGMQIYDLVCQWMKARLIITMLSARVVARIGCKSSLSVLPTELFRVLKTMLVK